MADERSYEYTPPEFIMTHEATASTSSGGTTGASSSLGAYTTIPDDVWKYQWNTQPTLITEGTYNVGDVPDNGITSYQQLGCVSSIDHARPSTSRAGMEEASGNFEGGATISESTMVLQEKTHYQLPESMSTVFGHTDMTETESTGLTLPVYSSSSSGDYKVASTSRTGTEEASDSSGNDARCLLLLLEAQSRRRIPMPDPGISEQCISHAWMALPSRTGATDVNGMFGMAFSHRYRPQDAYQPTEEAAFQSIMTAVPLLVLRRPY
nr:uncharacterized protein LOC129381646 [Dermacentor andersoni]